MQTDRSQSTYQFLRDKPLGDEGAFKSSRFGHAQLANTLADIVTTCETPFTIGLFGKWGSGKSSITNMLVHELKTNRKVAAVVFDVWKHHAGDSLRRSFLLDLVCQLKDRNDQALPEDFKLSERLSQVIEVKAEGDIEFKSSRLRPLLIPLLLLLVCLIVIGVFFAIYGEFREFLTLMKVFAPMLAGGGIGSWIAALAMRAVTTQTETRKTDRLQDPHEFACEFGRVLSSMEPNRILIVFDNLDRVTHDVAVSMLSTIKTFLEPKDEEIKTKSVVFLIPCDRDAISEHIERVYSLNNEEDGSKAFDSSEFLNKFFNASLWIPEFRNSELLSYAMSSLEKTRVEAFKDDTIAWLITKVFRDNPRQIIQFINTMLAHYLIQRTARLVAGKSYSDTNSENTRQLCLFLLLSVKYPATMTELRESGITNLSEAAQKLAGSKDREKVEFIKFVGQVSADVSIGNLRRFYSLQMTEAELQLSGIEELFDDVQDGKWEEVAQDSTRAAMLLEKPYELGLAVKSRLDALGGTTAGIHFIDGLLHLKQRFQFKLQYAGCAEILHLLIGELRQSCDQISPQLVYETTIVECPHLGSQMAGTWVDRIAGLTTQAKKQSTSLSFARDVLEVFLLHPNYAVECRQHIRTFVADKLASDVEIASLLARYPETHPEFVSDDYLLKYVESIDHAAIAKVVETKGHDTDELVRLCLISRFQPALYSTAVAESILKKHAEVLDVTMSTTWADKLEDAWKLMSDSICRLLAIETNRPLSDDIGTALTKTATKASTHAANKSKSAFKVLLHLESSLSQGLASSTTAPIQSCLQSMAVKDIIEVTRYKPDMADYLGSGIHSNVLKTRALGIQTDFDLLYVELTQPFQTTWIKELFSTDVDRGLKKMASLKWQFPDAESVLMEVLKKASVADISTKSKLLLAVIEGNFVGSTIVRNDFVGQISMLAGSDNEKERQLALNFVEKDTGLCDDDLRHVCKRAYDYLLKQPVEQRYQISSLRVVSILNRTLNDTERGNITQLCFDDVILKGSSVNQINEGFRILDSLNPNGNDCFSSKNLGDIIFRIGQEENDELRKSLEAGLKSLRPKTQLESNIDIWSEVDKLP